jgi:trigger factor
LKEQIINQLIARHSFTPPPAMVERQTRYLMERNQNRGTPGETSPSLEETRKALEGRALRQVQATLLVEKVAALENIAVSEKEVQERVDSLARGAGEKGKTVREFYSRPEARDDLHAQMIFDRTLAFLLERAKIKEVDPEPAKVDDQAKKS